MEKALGTQAGISVAGIQVLALIAAFFFIGFSESIGLGWFLLLANAGMTKGYFQLKANEAVVLLLQGHYKGSVRLPGFYWVNPFYTKQRVSLKPLLWQASMPLADKAGMPLQASAMATWQVADTAMAVANVADMEGYAHFQCQAALAEALAYQAYQSFDSKTAASYLEKTNEIFLVALKQRLRHAGLEAREVKIVHIAPSQEAMHAIQQRAELSHQLALQKHLALQAVPVANAVLAKLTADGVALSPSQQEELRAQLLLGLVKKPN